MCICIWWYEVYEVYLSAKVVAQKSHRILYLHFITAYVHIEIFICTLFSIFWSIATFWHFLGGIGVVRGGGDRNFSPLSSLTPATISIPLVYLMTAAIVCFALVEPAGAGLVRPVAAVVAPVAGLGQGDAHLPVPPAVQLYQLQAAPRLRRACTK